MDAVNNRTNKMFCDLSTNGGSELRTGNMRNYIEYVEAVAAVNFVIIRRKLIRTNAKVII